MRLKIITFILLVGYSLAQTEDTKIEEGVERTDFPVGETKEPIKTEKWREGVKLITPPTLVVDVVTKKIVEGVERTDFPVLQTKEPIKTEECTEGVKLITPPTLVVDVVTKKIAEGVERTFGYNTASTLVTEKNEVILATDVPVGQT